MTTMTTMTTTREGATRAPAWPFRARAPRPEPTPDEAREAALRRSIGARVRARRKAAGMTMDRLGEAAGCSQSFLSKLETGLLMPSLPMLVRLAEALGDEPAAYLARDPGAA